MGPNRWFDPTCKDVLALELRDRLPEGSSSPYQDLLTLRKELAFAYDARKSTLVEADIVSLGGARALYTLVKESIPDAEHGYIYRGAFLLAKRTRTLVLRGQFEEYRWTGVRETRVWMQLGLDSDLARIRHPYAPEISRWDPANDEKWDAMLPKHALSKARAWARRVRASAWAAPGLEREPDR